MSYTTDNRYAPKGSGAAPPLNAPAAYSARWIDMGDDVPADVPWDRQGLAYNDTAARDTLVEALNACTDNFRTPYKVGLTERDKTTVIMNHPAWKCYMRRAGGYIYVDAWLTPPADNPTPLVERLDWLHCLVQELEGAGVQLPMGDYMDVYGIIEAAREVAS